MNLNPTSHQGFIINNMSTTYSQIVGLFILTATLFTPACTQGERSTEKEPSSPPNIVFIISDDQAWGDYGFLGHEHIETPRLDQLAKESLTFPRGYVTAPLCSPSLATIISGLYPHQHGITGNDPAFDTEQARYQVPWRVERTGIFRPAINRFNQLPLLTSRLKELDYLSLQTGKWWMGSWKDGHFTHGMTHGDPQKNGRHGDDGLTIGREGLQPIYDFIQEAEDKDQPFLVWYAPFLPHAPHTPPEELLEKYREKAPTEAIAKYWAMCEWFDQTCGELLDHLDEKQLTEETLVVYVCDNGWIQQADKPNRYAPRSKRSPYEGGIRTPIMFKWPGQIKPERIENTLVSSIDIVPTILAACNLEKDANLPGINVMDRESLNQRTTIFAEAYEHDIETLEDPTRSLTHRIGIQFPWKLIVPDTTNLPNEAMELFNLAQDPDEENNLITAHPEEAKQLFQQIGAWWTPQHLQP